MDKVRFGVVGLGNMGSGHTRNLFEGKIPGAVLTAVCDIKPDRLDWARGICGDSVAYFADSHEMIKSGLVDAVMIATPHYFHPIIGIDAFENGLNVLSGKDEYFVEREDGTRKIALSKNVVLTPHLQ